MTNTSLDSIINDLVEIVKPIVVEIEGHTPITQNRYDEYLMAITKVGDYMLNEPKKALVKREQCYLLIGAAMRRAGANGDGVISALTALGVSI
jgi:hypothetical protein